MTFIARDDELVRYRIKPNLPVVGRKHGKAVPAIRAALATADGAAIARAAEAGERFELAVDGGQVVLEPGDVLIETESAAGYQCAEDSGFLVALDTSLTDALREEGLAREIIRSVQDARKQAGLKVSDRIALSVTGSPDVEATLQRWRDTICEETLADRWRESPDGLDFRVDKRESDSCWSVALSRLAATPE